jgi:outer membrane beta-barrel protein
MLRLAFALLGAFALQDSAFAADTLDIGVLKNEDISVVQKMLYPKHERTEFGVHLGVIPFDGYVVSPNLQLSLDRHLTDTVSLGALIGGGYGFKNGVTKQLESPTFGVAPYAYRYLGSVLLGAQWAPIYAKLNWNGARVLHFDVYGAGRFGGAIEQSVFPDATLAFGPAISPALGARIWIGEKTSLRTELRDDFLLERRSLTQTWNFKQNANVQLGLTFFGAAPAPRQ